MNRGGIGSASIVLVFAVLCLAIFTVISLMPAMTEQTLIERELQLVEAFYAADTLAEKILAEILAADTVPETVMGIDIEFVDFDFFLMAEIISFSAPVIGTRELYVEVALGWDFYEIMAWHMYDAAGWDADETLNVFQGSFDFFD